jgi:hypothetical protein
MFRIKRNPNGEIQARVVGARGFTQIEGVDYNETFAPFCQVRLAVRGSRCLCQTWYDGILTHRGQSHTVFTRTRGDNIIALYVDDITIVSEDMETIN